MIASNGLPHTHPSAGGTRHVECDDCYAAGPAEPSPRDGRAWNDRVIDPKLITAVKPFISEIDRLEKEYGFDQPAHQLQPMMITLADLLALRDAFQTTPEKTNDRNE